MLGKEGGSVMLIRLDWLDLYSGLWEGMLGRGFDTTSQQYRWPGYTITFQAGIARKAVLY